MATETQQKTHRVADAGVEQTMALIEKSQQLAGHFPDDEALGRARRLLEGKITPAEGRAELDAKYSQG